MGNSGPFLLELLYLIKPYFANQSPKPFIELDDGKIYRKALYLIAKTMVSCRFSLKPIQ
jgi:hypothetical protein